MGIRDAGYSTSWPRRLGCLPNLTYLRSHGVVHRCTCTAHAYADADAHMHMHMHMHICRCTCTCAYANAHAHAHACAYVTRPSTAVSSPSRGPSCSRTLAGLTSQWRKPRACAWRSAASKWRKKWRACRSGRDAHALHMRRPMHSPCATYVQPAMHGPCVPAAQAARRAAARLSAHPAQALRCARARCTLPRRAPRRR